MKKLTYPKSVLFVLVHQVFEKFAFWGIVVVLPLFLRNVLKFDDDSSTALYHGFLIFGYFSSFVGAIVADSYFGKYRTIFWFSFVYFVGTFLLSTSATQLLSSELALLLAVGGLLLTALASGAIQPCIIAYGGDQFKLPEQQKQLDEFFPVFYLIVNLSLFLTAIITPMLRKEVACFGATTCYSLAFIVPFILVIISFVIFVIGKSRYTNIKVENNVVGKAAQCIKTAVIEKLKSKHRTRSHWLDYADSKFSQEFIGDVKTVIDLLILFLPLTMFWALFDQQFSRWTFQATRMDDRIFGYAVKPDQFATLNFIFTFCFIPLFEKVVFPSLSKCNLLKKPLQRVITGCMFASLAFVICGCLEINIESKLESLPMSMESQLNIMNNLPCSITALVRTKSGSNLSETMLPSTNFIYRGIPSGAVAVEIMNSNNDINANLQMQNHCKIMKPFSTEVKLFSGKGHSILVYSGTNDSIEYIYHGDPDDLVKSLESNSKLRIIYAGFENSEGGTIFIQSASTYQFNLNCSKGFTRTEEIIPNKYRIIFQKGSYMIDLGEIEVFVGGNYVLAITTQENYMQSEFSQKFIMNLFTIIKPNSISMLWLLPQYAVMSVAEVMLDISLTGYAYSEAPETMKSVMQVVKLIPPALGGIIVVFVSEVKIFNRQSMEFFLFAAINFGATLMLVYLAIKYKPKESQRNATG